MKSLIIAVLALASFGAVYGQDTTTANTSSGTVPTTSVKDMDGKSVDLYQYLDSAEYTIISFWATWCGPCIKELQAIQEVYEDWQTKYNVQLIAVSIDDSRTSKKVQTKVLGYGWEYIVLLDENQDLGRAMNVNNPPMLFIVDKKGNIKYSHQGYTPGEVSHIEDLLKQYTGKE